MAHYKTKWLFCGALLFCASCRRDVNTAVPAGNYPAEIGTIIINKCAVSGCHNTLSYMNAANLDLTTWDALFKGTTTGAAVIPYRPDFSSLCFFTNTDSSLGITLQPTMPLGKPPLTKEEYLKISDWIAAGAPDANGKIKFVENTSGNKFYVTNRMCNLVTVIDGETQLQMRAIDVGNNTGAKYPYCIKVSPDKKYWYVSFFSQTNIVQKFSAGDDRLIGEIKLGEGTWTSFEISSNSRYAWFVDNNSTGKIAYTDLESRSVLAVYTFGGNFRYPSGIALDETHKKLYIGSSSGNFVYKIDVTNPISPSIAEMPIDGSSIVQYQSMLDPTELLADPITHKCYIACATSGEIRLVDMVHDSLISVVPLGTNPAFMAFSGTAQKLFVSCPDDMVSFPGNRGAVVVVDAATNTVCKKINTGYQPYGMAIDVTKNAVAVVNANISSEGPASHHASRCGEKNGNVSFIGLNTLELVLGKRLEMAVFPFSATAR